MKTSDVMKALKKRAENNPEFVLNLRKVLGLSINTVSNWLEGVCQPAGWNLISLAIVLSDLGEEIPEVNEINPSVYALTSLIAYKVATPVEACTSAGYKHDHHVRSVFIFGEGITDEKVALMKGVVQKHHAVFEQKRAAAQILLGLTNSESDDAQVMEFVELVRKITPLGNALNSDKVSKETRAKVHELLGHGKMFEVAQLFQCFCSESARAHVLGKKR